MKRLGFKMKLEVIDTNRDHITNKPYDLYKVNLQELSELIKSKYPKVNFADFNRDHISHRNPEYDHTDKEMEDNFIFNASTENNFISIYSEEGIKLTGKFYLLDGFRRLLYDFKNVKKDKDKEVYVKVYDKNTTDQDMMKLMFHMNLWKFPQGINVWLDRGWRFFIFERLGILVQSESERDDNYNNVGNHFGLLEDYFRCTEDYQVMYKMITSEIFYDDIALFDTIIKGKTLIGREGKDKKDSNFAWSFASYLGRRRAKGKFDKIEYADLIKLIKVKVNDINKIKKMEVQGFYIKEINSLMVLFFEIMDEPKLLFKLRNMEIPEETEILVKDFVEKLPKEIIEKYNIDKKDSRSYEKAITINKKYYQYENNKIYTEHEGIADPSKLRIYLFFEKYALLKWNDKFIVIDVSINNRIQYMSYGRDVKNEIIKGTQEECLAKIKEMTGREFAIDRKRTVFW